MSLFIYLSVYKKTICLFISMLKALQRNLTKFKHHSAYLNCLFHINPISCFILINKIRTKKIEWSIFGVPFSYCFFVCHHRFHTLISRKHFV